MKRRGLGVVAAMAMSVGATGAEAEHFVLVHGAWHVAKAWDGVIAELEKRGHTAEAVVLPGFGADADRGKVPGIDASLFHSAGNDALRLLPDFQRVVLDPTRLRIDLAVLELVDAHGFAAVVEDHAAGAGCALVNCSDKSGHVCLPFA